MRSGISDFLYPKKIRKPPKICRFPGTGGGGGPGPWRRGAGPGDAAGGAAGPCGASAAGAAGAGGGDRGTGGAGEVVRVPPPWINMVNGNKYGGEW